MRSRLLESRLPLVQATSLVRVLRILFLHEYGMYRQLICPQYGVTSTIVHNICIAGSKISKALSNYLAYGPFMFAGEGQEPVDALRKRVMSEIALIRGGEGGDLLSGVEAWVRVVQFRALQDMAKEYPDHFDDCWTVVQYSSWGGRGDIWLTNLRQREDRDIGWLWSLKTSTWSSSMASLEKDKHIDKPAESYTPESTAIEGLRVLRADVVFRSNNMAETSTELLSTPKCIPRHDSSPPLQTPEEDAPVDIAHHEYVEDGVHSPSQGSAAIFPEIRQAIEIKPNQEGHEPLVTVTQVIRGVHDVQIPQQGTEFEASLSQWMVASTPDLARTPPRGVLRELDANEVGQSVQQGVDSCSRRLQDQFEQEMATTEHISMSTDDGLAVGSRGGTFSATSSDSKILDAKVFKGNTLWEVYSQLKIDALLKAVPTQDKGTVRTKDIVFFNHCGKEMTLKHKDIRELKNSEVRLGNDIVDFVLSRIYMAYPEERRHEIHIISSRVSAYMLLVMRNAKSAEKFARDWLQPPDGVEVHQVKELIVPWVCDDHWSVLVFQANRVFHMDSCLDAIHKPRDKHSEFLRWMSCAWQRLRGVEEYPVGDIININVFQQVGGNECGHLSICNVMLYLKVRFYSMDVLKCCRKWSLNKVIVAL